MSKIFEHLTRNWNHTQTILPLSFCCDLKQASEQPMSFKNQFKMTPPSICWILFHTTLSILMSVSVNQVYRRFRFLSCYLNLQVNRVSRPWSTLHTLVINDEFGLTLWPILWSCTQCMCCIPLPGVLIVCSLIIAFWPVLSCIDVLVRSNIF